MNLKKKKSLFCILFVFTWNIFFFFFFFLHSVIPCNIKLSEQLGEENNSMVSPIAVQIHICTAFKFDIVEARRNS